jgi:Flp pilus assembly protein TadD
MKAQGQIGGGGPITARSSFRPPPPSIPPSSLGERPHPFSVATSASEIDNAERALEAMTSFRLAESALQRGDVGQAERLAHKAMTADPEQTDYAALHAWIRAMASTSDSAMAESLQALTKLVEADPSERVLLYRGKLYKRARKLKEALRDFERVCQLNPRHKEAMSEVRLLRQAKPAK